MLCRRRVIAKERRVHEEEGGLIRMPGVTAAGDRRAIGIHELILREEVVHVAIGNDWFHRLCQERGLDPVADWDALAAANAVATPAPPFNRAARLQAGFVEPELQRWEARARRPDL